MKVQPNHFISPIESATKNIISHTNGYGYVYPTTGPAVIVKLSKEALALLQR
jgi:hypothetical protein